MNSFLRIQANKKFMRNAAGTLTSNPKTGSPSAKSLLSVTSGGGVNVNPITAIQVEINQKRPRLVKSAIGGRRPSASIRQRQSSMSRFRPMSSTTKYKSIYSLEEDTLDAASESIEQLLSPTTATISKP